MLLLSSLRLDFLTCRPGSRVEYEPLESKQFGPYTEGTKTGVLWFERMGGGVPKRYNGENYYYYIHIIITTVIITETEKKSITCWWTVWKRCFCYYSVRSCFFDVLRTSGYHLDSVIIISHINGQVLIVSKVSNTREITLGTIHIQIIQTQTYLILKLCMHSGTHTTHTHKKLSLCNGSIDSQSLRMHLMLGRAARNCVGSS